MKLAVVGSRNIDESFVYQYLSEHIPKDTEEIVTGGAKGTDSVAIRFANDNNIKLTLFSPEYNLYKKGAPLKRNLLISEYSDYAIVFWDGESKGTKHIIKCFSDKNIDFELIYVKRPL